MKYDEVRVVLSATPKGRFKTQVSMAGAAPIEDSFVPPEGVDGAVLYRDWFESFETEPSPEAKRALEERRRSAGERLFEALFSSAAPRIREHLKVLEDRFRTENGGQRGLRVRLILGDAWGKGKANAEAILPVSNLPHELMVPPGLPKFLARRPFISIVRTIGVAEFIGPMRVSGKLRVLVANAEPEGSVPLGWAEEVGNIQSALEPRTDTTVEVLKNASFEATWQRLRAGGFHVLHFIGHGGYDPASGQWYLLFEKERARQPVLAEKIADRLGDLPMLRLAVLNACHSGELAREAGGNPLAGIAAALSVYGLPAVIGMQVAVTDSAAIEFAKAFYGALREREPIEVALADGRSAIDDSSPEWATPVLYLRGETSELFEFEVNSNGPVIREDGPPELKLGIRTLVESEKFPHLAAWAKKLETTTEKLLPLEEFFEGRFITDPGLWGGRVLPRLNRFLADAVEQDRPLALSLAAHGTVAFAAGYYFHTKAATKVTLLQVTSGETLRWSEKVGTCPQGSLWQSFEETVFDPSVADVAVAVEITQSTSAAVKTYLAQSGTSVGRLISARIAGEPGKTRVESGAHAYQLAWQLQQWLKDHTGNRGQRRLHLFISAPNGFVFFFGQLSQSLGFLRLYEYDFEGTPQHGTYEPSLDLPQTAPE
jgi:CBASS immunity sensor of nucleotide second messenger signals/CHAT domain-containing protein